MLDVSCLHRRASRVLPESLHTSSLMDAPVDEAGLASWMLPLRHVPRGSLRFRLDETTAQSLLRDPWACLGRANHARQGLGPRTAPLQYATWQCVREGDDPIYCTQSRDRRARICLLPSRRLLVYRWNDQLHATQEEGTTWTLRWCHGARMAACSDSRRPAACCRGCNICTRPRSPATTKDRQA